MANKLLKYISFAILLFGIYLCSFYVNFKSLTAGANQYDFSRYIWIASLIYIPIGLCLGVPRLMGEKKKSGSWKLNTFKLIFIGIPALYFSSYLLIYAHLPSLQIEGVLGNALFQGKATSIASVILGYTIITSFYKE
ncbi:hypothetical protein [Bacillus sp. EAC]|uniref:hypothetical protein n=1 Tax=Bacillus sp. EAC TaxID=1978338 RepID=UPI0011550B40|nr:hypothetical protein [Bacillus sp. EAC]